LQVFQRSIIVLFTYFVTNRLKVWKNTICELFLCANDDVDDLQADGDLGGDGDYLLDGEGGHLEDLGVAELAEGVQ